MNTWDYNKGDIGKINKSLKQVNWENMIQHCK